MPPKDPTFDVPPGMSIFDRLNASRRPSSVWGRRTYGCCAALASGAHPGPRFAEVLAQLAQGGANNQLAQLIQARTAAHLPGPSPAAPVCRFALRCQSALLQKQLSKMVGTSSGYIESLPAPVQVLRRRGGSCSDATRAASRALPPRQSLAPALPAPNDRCPDPIQRRIDYLRDLESERNHLEEQFEEVGAGGGAPPCPPTPPLPPNPHPPNHPPTSPPSPSLPPSQPHPPTHLRSHTQELRALEQKYTALYQPLYEKRAAVVQGKVRGCGASGQGAWVRAGRWCRARCGRGGVRRRRGVVGTVSG